MLVRFVWSDVLLLWARFCLLRDIVVAEVMAGNLVVMKVAVTFVFSMFIRYMWGWVRCLPWWGVWPF